MFALRGVRARLTASLVALVALTAVVLGVGASWFVDLRLHDQALTDAAAQAGFDLSVVVPGRQLPDQPTPDEIDRSGLADTFQRGNVETFVDLFNPQCVAWHFFMRGWDDLASHDEVKMLKLVDACLFHTSTKVACR